MINRPSNDSSLPAMIRKSQLIAAGIILGTTVLSFVAAAVGGSVRSATPVLAYLAVAFAAQITALRLFIPSMFVKSQLKALKFQGASSIAEKLQELFQIRMIIAMALLVGATLFNLIAYIINGQWFSLATATFLVLLMVTLFPTARGFEKWVEEIDQFMN